MSNVRILEKPCRLSESVAWEMQRRFFEATGPNAWADGVVPYYATTNAYVARCYAHVIAAWVEDLLALGDAPAARRLDPTKPIYVIELGAGTGCLSFLLANELEVISRERELPRFRVVGTDFVEANVAHWQNHSDLRESFEAGRLDAAIFDADAPGPLELMHAGDTLGPAQLANPVVTILNYVVDSLRQDAFLVKDGELHEITVQAALPADSIHSEHAPEAASELQLQRDTRRAHPPFYGDPSLDAILAHYVESLEHAEFLMPVGTVRALRFLRELAGGRLCVLTADKGFRRSDDLEGRALGDLVKNGAFSFMANFDAIGRDLGGVALTHDIRYSRFTVAAYSTVDAELPRFRGAYRESINEFGPAEFNRLFKLARSTWADPPIALILLMLRLSAYDPGVFALWADRILESATTVGAAIRQDLGVCLEQVLARTFRVSRKDDVRFSAGRIYYRLGQYAEAAAQFERVIADTPERSAAWYNLGLCREREGSSSGARGHYERTLELDPSYERARQALERLAG